MRPTRSKLAAVRSIVLFAFVSISTLAEQVPTETIKLVTAVENLTISRSEKICAIASGKGTIDVIDLATRKTQATFHSEGFDCDRLKFSRDDSILFCQSSTGLIKPDRRVEVWRIKDQTLLFSNHPKSGRAFLKDGELPRIYHADLSPDGASLIFASSSFGPITIFDIQKLEPTSLNLPPDTNAPLFAEFSTDGKLAIAISPGPPNSDEEQCMLFNTQTRKLVSKHALKGARYSGMFADGRVAVSRLSDDSNHFDLYELDKEKPLLTQPLNSSIPEIFTLVLDGSAIACKLDQKLEIIDIKSGKRDLLAEIAKYNTLFSSSANCILFATRGEKGVQLYKPTDSHVK